MTKLDLSRLKQHDIDEIQVQFDAALDNPPGSGDHWILIGLLNQKGFPVRSTEAAMELAERIIIQWGN